VMSRTVRVNPLLVLLAVLVGASIGSWIGGIFGAFVAALIAIPAAGAIQVLVREIWHATDPQPAAGAKRGKRTGFKRTGFRGGRPGPDSPSLASSGLNKSELATTERHPPDLP
jgi:hypothetical protein